MASSTSSTTCAMRMLRRAMTTLSFSAIRLVLPLRRMPAVSTKTYSVPLQLDGFIDRIAGGAGDGGDDGALLAGEGVQESRFADVGAADDGDLDLRDFLGRPRIREKLSGDVVEQSIDADAVLGGDGEDVAECRAHRTRGPARRGQPVSALLTARVTGLPRRRSMWARSRSGAGDFAAAVDQEDDLSGVFERDTRLLEDLAGDVLVIVDDDAAGVDQFEAACRRCWRSRGCGRG